MSPKKFFEKDSSKHNEEIEKSIQTSKELKKQLDHLVERLKRVNNLLFNQKEDKK